jgi:hypothetical protein
LNQEEHLPAPPRSASRAKRIVEWFWRGGALAEKKSSLPEPSARAAVLAQRAHTSADLALNTAELARNADAERGALADTGQAARLAEATTSEFYRQSVYWSLCALAARSDEHAGTSYDEAIWDTLDEKLLTDAASSEHAEALRTSLRQGSFVYFAELPAREQAVVGDDLRKLADALFLQVDARTRALQGILLQRAWRLSLIFVALVLIAGGVVWERKTREERSDLTQGASWRTSSKWENVGCTSPDQVCPESPAIFFHTKEEKEPWIEFDLGSAHQIAAVQVDNRPDCCAERTIPLVVEVSDNHKKWKPVARQEADFKTWRPSFAPTKARWVRLRVDRTSFLHLARVRIFEPQ